MSKAGRSLVVLVMALSLATLSCGLVESLLGDEETVAFTDVEEAVTPVEIPDNDQLELPSDEPDDLDLEGDAVAEEALDEELLEDAPEKERTQGGFTTPRETTEVESYQGVLAAIRDRVQPLALGGTAEGAITAADALTFEEETLYFDSYALTVEEGQFLVLETAARSAGSELDTVLTLFDEQLNELSFDDDGGEGLDSRLGYLAPYTGRYYVLVEGFGNEFGPAADYFYTLSAETGTAPTPFDPTAAPEIAPGDEVEGAIRQDDLILLAGEDLYGDIYTFEASQGQQIIFDVDAAVAGSELDSVLVVFDADLDEVARNDDADDSLDSELRFPVPAPGRYFLLVRDFGGDFGADYSYTVRVSLGEPVAGFEPSDAIPLSPGETVAGVIEADDLVAIGTDLFYGDIYAIALNGGERLVLDVDTGADSELDSTVTLYDEALEQVAFDDDSDDLDSLLAYTAPEDGVYFAVVADFGGDVGDSYTYRLTATLGEPAAAFAPEQAEPLALGAAVEGVISADDLVEIAGTEEYADVYAVEATAGEWLVLDVDTEVQSDLDSILTLYDNSLEQLAFNDDSEGLDPRIEIEVPSDGVFYVVVADLGDGFGPAFTYTLHARTGERPESLDPASAPVLTAGETVADAITADDRIAVEGELLYADVYAVVLESGDAVTVDVDAASEGSDLDSYLILYDEDLNEVAANDDDESLDSRINYSAPGAGRYLVLIKDLGDEFGAPDEFFYELTVEIAR